MSYDRNLTYFRSNYKLDLFPNEVNTVKSKLCESERSIMNQVKEQRIEILDIPGGPISQWACMEVSTS